MGRVLRPFLLRSLNDYWLAVSRSLLREASIDPGDPRAAVVPNGVADSVILSEPRGLRSSAAAGPVVGILGRVEPLKGQEEFIDMAHLVLESGTPARFVIGGSILGPPEGRRLRRAQRYERNLHTRVDARGLQDRLCFVGEVDDVTGFLDALDVLVVPSHNEGFGRVVIEGMARGLPVVANRVGGIPEILDETTGVLVPPRSPRALADATVALLRDPAGAHAMGEQGRQRVLSSFRSLQTTEGILDFYARITGRELTPVIHEERGESVQTVR